MVQIERRDKNVVSRKSTFFEQGPGQLLAAYNFLKKNRHLIMEMTMRDLRDRYVSQWFGLAWSIFHPIFLVVVYVGVFQFVFKVRLADIVSLPGDYTSLVISGLIPWLALQESLPRGTTCITGHAALIKQIAFPIEVLPIKSALATMPTVIVLTTCLFLYNFFTGTLPPATVFFLPIYWILMLGFFIAMNFILGAVGVFMRDIKDFIQLVFTAGLFLSPILYLPDTVPSWLNAIFYANPLSYVIWPHKDIVFYGGFAHPVAWIVFITFNILLLLLGIRLFQKLKPKFGDIL